MLIFFGSLIQLFGFLLCFTIIGAIIGIPLILIGGMMVFAGLFGRKTTITNVITVSQPGKTAQNPAGKPTAPPTPASTTSSLEAPSSPGRQEHISGDVIL